MLYVLPSVRPENIKKNILCLAWCAIKFARLVDLRGWPTVTAINDHYFRTCCLYVRTSVCPFPLFKITQNKTKERIVIATGYCGSGRVDHWCHTCLVSILHLLFFRLAPATLGTFFAWPDLQLFPFPTDSRVGQSQHKHWFIREFYELNFNGSIFAQCTRPLFYHTEKTSKEKQLEWTNFITVIFWIIFEEPTFKILWYCYVLLLW